MSSVEASASKGPISDVEGSSVPGHHLGRGGIYRHGSFSVAAHSVGATRRLDPIKFGLVATWLLMTVNIILIIYDHVYLPTLRRLIYKMMMTVSTVGIGLTAAPLILAHFDKAELIVHIKDAIDKNDKDREADLRVSIQNANDSSSRASLECFGVFALSTFLFILLYAGATAGEAFWGQFVLGKK